MSVRNDPPTPRRVWALLPLLLLAVACRSEVVHGLDERQATEVQSVLSRHGIEAERTRESGREALWTLAVPRERATESIRLLAELGLPRKRADGFSEVFGKGSLVPSPTEERALYLQALSGEVARTLESIDQVISARVHLVLPPAPRAGQPQLEPKASALLRVKPGARAQIVAMADDLKALVAGGVEGLQPTGVTVVIHELESENATARLAPRLEAPPSRGQGPMVPALGGGILLLSLAALGLVFRMRAQRKATRPASHLEPVLGPSDTTPAPASHRRSNASSVTPVFQGTRL